MIRQLRIQNLAIIESLNLEFGSGLNILTGETGAGKSIILGALRLVLGDRATAEDIRSGAETAEAEALIDGPLPEPVLRLLEEFGFPADPEGLALRREISVSGKSKAVVNGKLAALHQLRAIGDRLVDLHGQHQHQSLLDAENHLAALDAFAGAEAQRLAMDSAYQAWAAARDALRRLEGDERALERERELLEHQTREIDQAQLRPGEDAELDLERARLKNAEQLRAAATAAHMLLQEGEPDAPAALALIGRAAAEIEALVQLDPAEQPAAEALADARFKLEDVAARMRDYALGCEGDPQRLAAVEERLELIRRMKRKYVDSIEAILAIRDECAERLRRLENRDEERERLGLERRKAAETMARAALALTERRRAAAGTLEKRLAAELSELQMKGARFAVHFSTDEAAEGEGAPIGGRWLAAGPLGVDRVEFLLSANPGEALKPLRRIASGGELSRIMLAIKSLLARRDGIPTLVFDEIDVGISGATALVVGQKMKRLSESTQVICITHLPQIAAKADYHLAVEKSRQGKRAVTAVRTLNAGERVLEIARLLGGDAESAVGRRHAEELLAQAR